MCAFLVLSVLTLHTNSVILRKSYCTLPAKKYQFSTVTLNIAFLSACFFRPITILAATFSPIGFISFARYQLYQIIK
jgi:hypothetical protein